VGSKLSYRDLSDFSALHTQLFALRNAALVGLDAARMSSQKSQPDGESSLVVKCRHGDPEALAALRENCHGSLLGILLSRGADRTEAEDLLADLWSDCVPGQDDRPSILEKFSGKCTLQGWLATVATNRWVDRKRKQSRFIDPTRDRTTETDYIHRIEAVSYASDDTLIALLRDCLKAAFVQCAPEVRVLLRLVHLHELSQREIVKMLGWSESKVSRFLKTATEEIEKHTLAEVKKRDPWLELTWQDFIELCETHQIGFM
jgi:RNA polymerase sigma factor (sigma-70 family)